MKTNIHTYPNQFFPARTFALLITLFVLFLGCKNENSTISSTDDSNSKDPELELTIIDQDYDKSQKLALKEDKLILIDFYTSWCQPCKILDKYVFQNDSIKKILAQNFILLKYNAENDSVFHLSKKHHVSSYPTGLILNKEGFIVNRKYGFSGQDESSLQKETIEFTEEGLALQLDNNIIRGYSNHIKPDKYPDFYKNYINRTNTKIDTAELSNYFKNADDKFSEEYFSTLIYFGRDAPVRMANLVLENKEKYTQLYGKTDVETLLYFLSSAKFKLAISELSDEKYNEALAFTKHALSEKWLSSILPYLEKEYLIAQNQWSKVYDINEKLKAEGEFDNSYVNNFSWQVYKKCDDQKVIKKCLEWMKVVTNEEASYMYLDTYAYLMHKSGNKEETKRIALLAIEAAKKEEQNSKGLEELISGL